MSEGDENTQEMEMVERVRPLVNEILERFNQEDVTPSEAGMVILALISRLLDALEAHPEPRRQFILNLIDIVNSYLVKEAGEASESCPAGADGPE